MTPSPTASPEAWIAPVAGSPTKRPVPSTKVVGPPRVLPSNGVPETRSERYCPSLNRLAGDGFTWFVGARSSVVWQADNTRPATSQRARYRTTRCFNASSCIERIELRKYGIGRHGGGAHGKRRRTCADEPYDKLPTPENFRDAAFDDRGHQTVETEVGSDRCLKFVETEELPVPAGEARHDDSVAMCRNSPDSQFQSSLSLSHSRSLPGGTNEPQHLLSTS